MSKPSLNIAIAQMNPTVGAIDENVASIISTIQKSQTEKADIILFPELAVTGYLPQDLIFDETFIQKNLDSIKIIVNACDTIVAIVGYIYISDNGKRYNAMAVVQKGQIIKTVFKTLLPTYDVFDEQRYFEKGKNIEPVDVTIGEHNYKLGIEICEDLWDEHYPEKVTDVLVENGAEIILNGSASPYSFGKIEIRHSLVENKVKKLKVPFVYNNLVGAQDELIFDGNSFALDAKGNYIESCMGFKEELKHLTIHFDKKSSGIKSKPNINPMDELCSALILGIKDYFSKSGFHEAILGLSGGVDSALVAVLAARALGDKHVYTYSMPSQFSSEHSKSDAKLLAENLGIHYETISIGDIYQTYMNFLAPHFENRPFGLAEENLQARIRGTLLMSLSNKFNRIVLTTANKTEAALGYSTLYGDMAGGLAPISDLNKLEVYALCRHINEKAEKELIPENILSKTPSAELADNQYDPFDYDVVSPLVEDILENHYNKPQLKSMGYEPDLIDKIYLLIKNSEYKRKQAPPGLRVSEKAFGLGRRMPIVNRYIEKSE